MSQLLFFNAEAERKVNLILPPLQKIKLLLFSQMLTTQGTLLFYASTALLINSVFFMSLRHCRSLRRRCTVFVRLTLSEILVLATTHVMIIL
jgi:hypothetical protein